MNLVTKMSLPLLAAFALSACNQEQEAPAQPPEQAAEQAAPKAKQPSKEELTAVPNGLSNEKRESLDKAITMTQGTVRYFNLEGGFWGIVADNGQHILPQNLAPEFRKDGLRLRFNAREVKDMMTIQQWGVLSTLSDIEVIGQADSKSGDPRL